MTKLAASNADKKIDEAEKIIEAKHQDHNWAVELAALAYAYGRPELIGLVKEQPEDFRVTELMDVVPSGAGEHTWLDISKTRINTDRLARELAKFAGVPNRDVGYSGMKDFHAVSRQWFSIWRPKGEELDWSEFALDGTCLHQVVKHSRKIKRNTHRANRFEIRIKALEFKQLEYVQLEQRLEQIKQSGVPNYFGAQRFGRNANNMTQVCAMFETGKRVKDRNLRGLLLSSARSWLFNTVLSQRVESNTWQTLHQAEPANLNGSNSTFISQADSGELERLAALDIHPTAPMWGEGVARFAQQSPKLAAIERAYLERFSLLQKGLEQARLSYQRRATRCVPVNFSWELSDHQLALSFELLAGQFATSVLREIVVEPPVASKK